MVGILTGQPMGTCEQPGLVLSLMGVWLKMVGGVRACSVSYALRWLSGGLGGWKSHQAVVAQWRIVAGLLLGSVLHGSLCQLTKDKILGKGVWKDTGDGHQAR